MIRTYSVADVLSLLSGAGWTLLLAAAVFLGSALIGCLIALMRMSPVRPLRWLAVGYIQLVQGIPPLVWLFVLFYGIAMQGWTINAWFSAGIGLSVYSGAFLGEIWYGALASVPKTQWEAGASLGLSRRQQLSRIILPQSVRIAIPPTVGFLVQIVKETSLVSTIGIFELTLAGRFLSAATYRPLEAYALVAVVYFLICFPLTHWSRALERKLNADR